MKRFALSLLAISIFTSVASAYRPVFTSVTPETVIVDLRLGQTSFECRGTAMDLDSWDTVYFSLAPPPDFMHFESTPGNPGSFRLWAENLTGANYGGYFVDVFASDSPTSIVGAPNVSFAIGIIPEPTSAVLLTAAGIVLRRRRF